MFAVERHDRGIGEQVARRQPPRSRAIMPHLRGLHSSTFQLKVHAFCGMRWDVTPRFGDGNGSG